MSIFTSEMIQPSVEFFNTELDCSGNASNAIQLDFVDDGLNDATAKQLQDCVERLILKRKDEIRQTIKAHLDAHQMDRQQLAEFVGQILHSTNLPTIYRKHVDPFLETGYCTSKELRLALLERLELSESDLQLTTPEIAESQTKIAYIKSTQNSKFSRNSKLFRKLQYIKSVQFSTFIQHFALLWANRVSICATPELSNITFNGLGGGLAYMGTFHVTLGQLLNLYNCGLLRTGECCHCPMFIYSFSGSPLSGAGQYAAFCPICHNTKYIYPCDVEGRSWRSFVDYNLPFDRKQPTHWTVTTLVHALDPKLQFRIP